MYEPRNLNCGVKNTSRTMASTAKPSPAGRHLKYSDEFLNRAKGLYGNGMRLSWTEVYIKLAPEDCVQMPKQEITAAGACVRRAVDYRSRAKSKRGKIIFPRLA